MMATVRLGPDILFALEMKVLHRTRAHLNVHYYSLIHSDEGPTLETSVFESFTVANLPYRPCG